MIEGVRERLLPLNISRSACLESPPMAGNEQGQAIHADEYARLRREHDELMNRDFGAWLEMVRHEGGSLREYEKSLSWRVTKPLRLVRAFQVRVKEAGPRAALSDASTVIRRALSRGRS